ncbi:MAG: hypothetical protein ACP5GD_03105 [Candidatus Micrarchaeia archaeon]
MSVREEPNFLREIIKLKEYTTPTQLADLEEALIDIDDNKNIKYAIAYETLDLCKLAKEHKNEMADAVIKLIRTLGQRPKVIMEILGSIANTLSIYLPNGMITVEQAIQSIELIAEQAEEVKKIPKDSEAADFAVKLILGSGVLKKMVRS